jgi:hypothetical protein
LRNSNGSDQSRGEQSGRPASFARQERRDLVRSRKHSESNSETCIGHGPGECCGRARLCFDLDLFRTSLDTPRLSNLGSYHLAALAQSEGTKLLANVFQPVQDAMRAATAGRVEAEKAMTGPRALRLLMRDRQGKSGRLPWQQGSGFHAADVAPG